MKCICNRIIKDTADLAATLLRQNREGGHLEICELLSKKNKTLIEQVNGCVAVIKAARAYRQAEKDLQDRVLSGKIYQGDGYADEVEATMRELDDALANL